MELITNRFNKKEYRCENCDSDFYVNEDDFAINSSGRKYWECPLCGNKNYIDSLFISCPKKLLINQNVNISDSQANALIKECVNEIKEHNQEVVCLSTQDGKAFGVRCGNDIMVYITDRVNIYVIKEGEV